MKRALLLSVIVAACAETTAPESPLLPQSAASVESGSGVLIIDDVQYMDCVGEDVVFHAEVPIRFRLVVTSTGRAVYQEPFIPNAGTGIAVGQQSGTVWILQRAVSPLVAISSDRTNLIFFTATQYWVSGTGPAMLLHSSLHVSTNANGDIKVDRFIVNRCELQ